MPANLTLLQRLQAREEDGQLAPLPGCIPDNLAPRLTLRPYQERALRYFITYFEDPRLRGRTSRLLFQMATGSGKTAVMAGLILYLYRQGYRNFLFFVSLTNIVEQTRQVFLEPGSPKALFRSPIAMDGREVRLREGRTFQGADPEAINLVFLTTQGLHNMRTPRENGLSLEDFSRPTVLISDEAHHLSAATKRGELSEQERARTWEHTVDTALAAHPGSLLLQFTATADGSTPELLAQKEERILVDYPLSSFREDGYSKEIKTLRTDVAVMDRALLAVVLSQYRLKLFQDRRLNIKPVVLFKAASVKDSQAFQREFIHTVEQLDGAELERLSRLTASPVAERAFRFFRERGVSLEQLALELREDFGAGRCISANDDGEAAARQLTLNTLESPDNPYRAVFEVRKLDEGWDVLNLFDIVRLYETRQSGGRQISPATVAEAQLIGRGARYCPFCLEEGQDPFRRKLDGDLDNPMRLCEELYYHCQNEHRYITELTGALRQTGIVPNTAAECRLTLRESFRASPLYQSGWVYANRPERLPPEGAGCLPPQLAGAAYSVSLFSGTSGEDTVLSGLSREDRTDPGLVHTFTLAQLAGWNYALLLHALAPYPALRFDRLRRRLTELTSTRELLTSPDYLGNVQLHITAAQERLTPAQVGEACRRVFGRIAQALGAPEEPRRGSALFLPVPLREVFTDKTVRCSDPRGDGAGIPQRLCSDPELRLDLSGEEWYAYTENFGTPEEKALVTELRACLPMVRRYFPQVFLVRNERQLALYDFAGGRRFEPDYLLLLARPGLQAQVFLEPKGEGFAAGEQWKEDFLLQLAGTARPAPLPDGTPCRLAGLRFFSRADRGALDRDLRALLEGLCGPGEKI